MRIIVQVRIDRGIPEEIWISKHRVLAKTVDDLGDRFRPTLHAAWLANIKQTYAAAALSENRVVIFGSNNYK